MLLTEVDGQDAVLLGVAGGGAGQPAGAAVNRHLISAADLSRDDALLVLDTADELARMSDRPIKKLPTLRGRTVVNLFFEDSTRTRISFEAAAKRLSADVINFSAKGSSVAKGESLKDTALTLEAMGADAVVIRHNASGAPHRLAELGARQRDQRRGRSPRAPHPGAAGRLHHPPPARPQQRLRARPRRRPGAGRGAGRAAGHDRRRRPAQPGGPVQRPAAAHARRGGARWSRRPPCCPVAVDAWPCSVGYDLDAALPKSDVVMMLRVQQERMNAAFFPSVREYSRRYGLDAARMAQLPEHAIVMHPGPMNRGVEIAAEVADSPRSTIVEQVANGVSVRMAVLYLLLGGAEAPNETPASIRLGRDAAGAEPQRLLARLRHDPASAVSRRRGPASRSVIWRASGTTMRSALERGHEMSGGGWLIRGRGRSAVTRPTSVSVTGWWQAWAPARPRRPGRAPRCWTPRA